MFSQGNWSQDIPGPSFPHRRTDTKGGDLLVRVKPFDMLGRVSDALMSTMYIEALVKVKV